MKVILITLGLALAGTLAVLGVRGQHFRSRPWQFWDDMVDQPKYKVQEGSDFYADGRVNRPIPAGTVAWGYSVWRAEGWMALRAEDLYSVERIPVKVDRALMNKGRDLFNTYCAACHDQTGSGKGITTQYGMLNPPSYHSDRLRNVPDGYIFQVITEGKGQMGSYRDKIRLPDRWAVVAYVRALQVAGEGWGAAAMPASPATAPKTDGAAGATTSPAAAPKTGGGAGGTTSPATAPKMEGGAAGATGGTNGALGAAVGEGLQ